MSAPEPMMLGHRTYGSFDLPDFNHVLLLPGEKDGRGIPKKRKGIKMAEVLIKVEHLHKQFKNQEVLHDISVEIHKGDVISIIGPSGSGKSTFLRCLNALESPTKGDIFFEGQSVLHSKNVDTLRQKMGMVFQQFNLFPHMSILDNLTLGPRKLLKKSKEEAEVKAMALLKRVGLEDKAGQFPLQLSGGQQQRVAIVRALAMEPDVMLFDEPTSALDPEWWERCFRLCGIWQRKR